MTDGMSIGSEKTCDDDDAAGTGDKFDGLEDGTATDEDEDDVD